MAVGKLFLIPIVIADDTEQQVIAPQVIEALTNLDYFLVENVRTARRYISKMKLGRVIEDLKFEILDKKTDSSKMSAYFQSVLNGQDVGVLSESGCPGIADPGAMAVAWAHQNNIQVIPLSGPSSILMALIASGFNGQSFTFHGYVPIDKKDRELKIKSMEKSALNLDQTQVFMDTPYRNQALFDDIVRCCKPETLLSVSKGITGKEEFILTKKVKEWRKIKLDLHKVPTIFSIYVQS